MLPRTVPAKAQLPSEGLPCACQPVAFHQEILQGRDGGVPCRYPLNWAPLGEGRGENGDVAPLLLHDSHQRNTKSAFWGYLSNYVNILSEIEIIHSKNQCNFIRMWLGNPENQGQGLGS